MTIDETSKEMEIVYNNHPISEEIKNMKDFYKRVSFSCMNWMKPGVIDRLVNYSSYVYGSIWSTLDSIEDIVKKGHLSDAFCLTRKLYDTILLDIHREIILRNNIDSFTSFEEKSTKEWLEDNVWTPNVEKIISILKHNPLTKDWANFFGWKQNENLGGLRKDLDANVHMDGFKYLLRNCDRVYIKDRNELLNNLKGYLSQLATLHISFIFSVNGHYLIASDYADYLDCGSTPPEGSQYWIAPFAQDAFNRYIKQNKDLSTFIKSKCDLEIK